MSKNCYPPTFKIIMDIYRLKGIDFATYDQLRFTPHLSKLQCIFKLLYFQHPFYDATCYNFPLYL